MGGRMPKPSFPLLHGLLSALVYLPFAGRLPSFPLKEAPCEREVQVSCREKRKDVGRIKKDSREVGKTAWRPIEEIIFQTARLI